MGWREHEASRVAWLEKLARDAHRDHRVLVGCTACALSPLPRTERTPMNKAREDAILALMIDQNVTREEATARMDGLLGALFGQTTKQRDTRFRDANWFRTENEAAR